MLLVLNSILSVTARLFLLSVVSRTCHSIHPDVYTEPKELGFQAYTGDYLASKSLYVIQPKLEGSLVAQLGPLTSKHFYKMASISVYLNSHTVYIRKSYTPPLYALCSVDNAHLVAQPDTVLVCSFRLYIPSSTLVFANASCSINCVNGSECAARLDLDFLKLQYSSLASTFTVMLAYNVTAYQLQQDRGVAQYNERPDITESLIYHSQTLPPVTVIMQPELAWHILVKDHTDVPLVQWGLPTIRTQDLFSLILSVLLDSPVQELKMKLVLGPTLRYRFQNRAPSEQAKFWKIQVTSKRYGALIRVRRIDGESPRHDISSPKPIADLVLEEVPQTDAQLPTTSSSREKFASSQENDIDYMDSASATESAELEAQLVDKAPTGQFPIQIRLLQLVQANKSEIGTDSPIPTILSAVPEIIPKPDAMHIFVQFEPKDTLEPPWVPAMSSPEPFKLRVLGLTPNPVGASLMDAFVSPFGPSSAGRLTDVTHHVVCRPVSVRSGPNERLLDTSSSTNPSCPVGMHLAPAEIEDLGPVLDPSLQHPKRTLLSHVSTGLSDYLMLALAATADSSRQPSIVPSIYGPLRSSEQVWAWRDLRGPTVRRWMLEGFTIHVTSKRLRRIVGWRIGAATGNEQTFGVNRSNDYVDRIEQTPLTVTARIYTIRPGTGQRVYLTSPISRSTSEDIPIDNYRSATSKDHSGAEPMEFDVTRMLPHWALVVRPVLDKHQPANPIPAAYIFHDAYSGRPQLIGRRPGRVMVSLVATSGDSQPLATTYIDIGNPNGGPDLLSVVAIRAECVDPAIRLSGHLSTANLSIGAEGTGFEKLHVTEFGRPSSFGYPSELPKTFPDFSLPNPQLLSVQLHGSHSPNDVLIRSAASSATRSPEFLRSLLYRDNPGSRKLPELTRYSSSATCPVHLLSVSLIMSDGNVLATHNVPPGQLRIASFGSDVVWDAAISMDSSMMRTKRDVGAKTSVNVRINSLVVWTPRVQSTSGNTFYAVPLGAMDDVVTAVQAGHPLRDPGPPLSPSKLIVNEDPSTQADGRRSNGLRSGKSNPDSVLDGRASQGSNDRANVFISSQSQINLPVSASNQFTDQKVPSTTMITYILVGVGCLAVVLFIVNGVILMLVRRRRQQRDQTSRVGRSASIKGKKGHFDLYNVETNDITKPGGALQYYSARSPHHCRPETYLPSYSDGHSCPLLMESSSPCPPDVVPLAAGLSCSSMGSANSAAMAGSLKQSLLMEPVMNPYMMTSDASSTGRFHTPLNSQSPNMGPCNMPVAHPVGMQANMSSPKGNWNQHPASFNAKYYQCLNSGIPNALPMPPGWPSHHSPTASNPCNIGYTSGLGSVGTAEGCSDEGVASGFEVISLSQELVHSLGNEDNNYQHAVSLGLQPQRQQFCGIARSITGGTNSTNSAGSTSGALPNRTLTSVFKRSPTSGIGAGSLSGESSTGELNECRQTVRRPDSIGLSDLDPNTRLNHFSVVPPDRVFVRRQTSSPQQYPLDHLKPTLPQGDPDSNHPTRSSCSNQMSESFTNSVSVVQRSPRNIRNVCHKNLTMSGQPNSTERLESAGIRYTETKSSSRENMGYRLTDAFVKSTEDRVSNEVDDSPVPLPPVLLLNSQVCFDAALSSQNQSAFNNPGGVHSVSENRIPLGSYKRSESFGMATKQAASNMPLAQLTTTPYSMLTAKCNGGAQFTNSVDEMVGDMSDEVSSESKSSLAFKKETSPFTATKLLPTSQELSTNDVYLHKIPAPEF
ncbi:hypothetical protein CRM22_003407 [Opisthorchis felineus]|uniref:DUF5735 domain-containing protein n=1 Tax=Opisthorchis felineus TaxID=147828 RepID=A0A4S2M1D8_OPIFE|nr:hypothetical protein CRM22_003407 [Opisthorchis felineus]